MDKNKSYMENLKMDEVPWHRLTTAYCRATEFPGYFKTIWGMKNLKKVRMALEEVLCHIEHQSTFWHSTPFAMIFLVRIFKHAVLEMEKNRAANYITEQLLNFFILIAECFKETDEMEHPEQLSCFSDMLKEEYLWSEEYDEEEDEARYYEGEVFPDDLFYSFYYYSYQVLLDCKPMLRKLEHTHFAAAAEELEQLLL